MDYQAVKLMRYKPKRSRSMISINKKGFRFNVACGKHMNRFYKYCELYYDKDEKVVAIKATNRVTENSIKIIKSPVYNPYICAVDFLKITGIRKLLKLPDNYKSIKTLPTWNEKNKMFLIDLKPLIK